MQNFFTVQWFAAAAAAGLLIYPRMGSLKGMAGGILARFGVGAVAETTDADRLASFKVLLPVLGEPLASQVWAKIQPMGPASPMEVTP